MTLSQFVRLPEFRPQWHFVVKEVKRTDLDDNEGGFDPLFKLYRADIGVLEPIEQVKMVDEMNRPGTLTIPVSPKQFPPDMLDAFENIGIRPLEVWVYWTREYYNSGGLTLGAWDTNFPDETRGRTVRYSYPVWAGPVTGWDLEGRDTVTVECRSMLHYLDLSVPLFPINNSTYPDGTALPPAGYQTAEPESTAQFFIISSSQYRSFRTHRNWCDFRVPNLGQHENCPLTQSSLIAEELRENTLISVIGELMNQCENVERVGDHLQGSNSLDLGDIFDGTKMGWGGVTGAIGVPQHEPDDSSVFQPMRLGQNGEEFYDPRGGRTLLEILEEFSSRGSEYGFEFRVTFVPILKRRDNHSSPLGTIGEAVYMDTVPMLQVSQQFGEDRSDQVVLQDEHLTSDISVSVSLLPENLCNIVYAIGGGSDLPSVGSFNEDEDSFTAYDEDGVIWHVAKAADSVINASGPRMYILSAPGIVGGTSDSTEVDEDEQPSSIQRAAETYLEGRQRQFLVPTNMEIALSNEHQTTFSPGTGGLINPHAEIEVGDTITLDFETGFGRAAATAARVKKKTLNIGATSTMALEFF